MSIEAMCASFIGILSGMGFIIFWFFVFIKQDIRFLKQDIQKNQSKIDELSSELIELRYKK